MKCNRCGYEQENSFIFCPACGFETPTEPLYDDSNTRVSANPAFHHLTNALKDTLFLAFCILMTASCGISLISGTGFNIINILITIFSWLVYSSAKSGAIDSSKLRFISGTVYAQYIIFVVAAVIMFVCAIILWLSIGVVYNAGIDLKEHILFTEPKELLILGYGLFTENVNLLYVLLGVYMSIFSIFTAIFSFFGLKKIHKFVQSLYQSADAGCISYLNCRAAGNWLIFFGIAVLLTSIPTTFLLLKLEMFTLLVSEAAYGAALIVLGIFVKKHFS